MSDLEANAMSRAKGIFLALVLLTAVQLTAGFVVLWLWGLGIWDPGPDFMVPAMFGPLLTGSAAWGLWEALRA